ncbi:hypothetical protein [Giesbergeria anulus]|uniref:hypothetical protein n=1 Tax=Giesbergeria anulus TaxID=180197 RepID=UPI0015A5B758|nr:hypothetical protein [Giesbergeria anulus]
MVLRDLIRADHNGRQNGGQVQTVAARRYLPALQAAVAKIEPALHTNVVLVLGR